MYQRPRASMLAFIDRGWALTWPLIIPTAKIFFTLHLVQTSLIGIEHTEGFSMLPTISHDGAFIVASPLPYWSIFRGFHTPPKRGDVVCATPLWASRKVIKRVIGVEGDLVEVEPRRGGTRKWIQDAPHDDRQGDGDAVARSIDPTVASRKGEEKWIKVPKGHVWLGGDNLANSTDSRTYGPVPYRLIKSKVIAQIRPNLKWLTNNVRHIDGPEIEKTGESEKRSVDIFQEAEAGRRDDPMREIGRLLTARSSTTYSAQSFTRLGPRPTLTRAHPAQHAATPSERMTPDIRP